MAQPELDRRAFLRALAGTTVAVGAATLGAAPALAASRAALIPPGKIGIQLYSVRNLVRDLGFARVLEELSRQGYREVEFAGYTSPASPGLTLAQLRSLLDANGLRAVGSHVSISALRGNLDAELDKAQVLGLPHLGTAQDLEGQTVAEVTRFAHEFSAWGARAATRGVKLYQHNHSFEFRQTADQPSRRRIDVFLAETDPRTVFLEMDVLWAFGGARRFPNADGTTFRPVDYVKRAPQRYPLFHVKDGRESAATHGYDPVEFGDGVIPFREFFAELPSRGAHHGVWEQDTAPSTPADRGGAFGASARSYQRLRDLRG